MLEHMATSTQTSSTSTSTENLYSSTTGVQVQVPSTTSLCINDYYKAIVTALQMSMNECIPVLRHGHGVLKPYWFTRT